VVRGLSSSSSVAEFGGEGPGEGRAERVGRGKGRADRRHRSSGITRGGSVLLDQPTRFNRRDASPKLRHHSGRFGSTRPAIPVSESESESETGLLPDRFTPRAHTRNLTWCCDSWCIKVKQELKTQVEN